MMSSLGDLTEIGQDEKADIHSPRDIVRVASRKILKEITIFLTILGCLVQGKGNSATMKLCQSKGS